MRAGERVLPVGGSGRQKQSHHTRTEGGGPLPRRQRTDCPRHTLGSEAPEPEDEARFLPDAALTPGGSGLNVKSNGPMVIGKKRKIPVHCEATSSQNRLLKPRCLKRQIFTIYKWLLQASEEKVKEK